MASCGCKGRGGRDAALAICGNDFLVVGGLSVQLNYINIGL